MIYRMRTYQAVPESIPQFNAFFEEQAVELDPETSRARRFERPSCTLYERQRDLHDLHAERGARKVTSASRRR
jgi:hypothetical protein